jgi:hypothetical protein
MDKEDLKAFSKLTMKKDETGMRIWISRQLIPEYLLKKLKEENHGEEK